MEDTEWRTANKGMPCSVTFTTDNGSSAHCLRVWASIIIDVSMAMLSKATHMQAGNHSKWKQHISVSRNRLCLHFPGNSHIRLPSCSIIWESTLCEGISCVSVPSSLLCWTPNPMSLSSVLKLQLQEHTTLNYHPFDLHKKMQQRKLTLVCYLASSPHIQFLAHYLERRRPCPSIL